MVLLNEGRELPDHHGTIRFAAVLLRPILAPSDRFGPVPAHP